MDVILLERVPGLGAMGETVKVKNGYARNFLLPRQKALRATAANREDYERRREHLVERNLETKKDAEKLAKKLDGKTYVIIRQAGETGQLYGSVATRDIADAITTNDAAITRTQVRLDRPIKFIGLHALVLNLHPEVEAKITLNVARSPDEAVRQAKGEDLAQRNDDNDIAAEIKANAEAIFENMPAGETL